MAKINILKKKGHKSFILKKKRKKIKGVVEDLKIKKKIFLMIIVRIYLGISLELLQAVWGQFSFR